MSPRRRNRIFALLLPVVGLILFMPPYLRIPSRAEHLFGMPVLHVYIFLLWLIAVVLTAIVSRRLIREPGAEPAERRKADETDPGQP
ncbi:hypothetical protein [Ferrovibrio sp.]|uniref:hypothetical protein n=1 Tax=Ferrovibrio sp. TaxID=1917215 RepID=UPI000CB8659E|nr:hypothetical protein [Ferrovibrio sp.]PJI38533.1 MAG: hypothetical protein CTR53_16780 [Ferrovibrio sp.]